MEARAVILLATFLLATTLANPISKPNEVRVINARHENDTETKLEAEAALKPWEWRLPKNYEPSHYDIQLAIEETFNETRKFTGVVIITFKVIKVDPKIHNITLNAFNMTLGEPSLKKIGTPTEVVQLGEVGINEELQRLTINMSKPLDVGKEYQLTIPYQGQLHEDMYGWYLSKYTENGKDEWVATTQFQPTHARRAFPCFDEPGFKAKFNIKITHPIEYSAISNGEVVTRTENGVKKTATTTFQETPIMSTYLIAFVVSKFSWINRDINGLHHRIWSQSELIGTGQYAHSVAPGTLKAMEDFTKVDYTVSGFKKLDQIAIPDFSAGAMENWGLVTYRESALLWDNGESTTVSKQRIASVIAHELAHMWFGNLLTCDWWSVTWLNEGFARYYQYFATDKVETDWELTKQFVVEQQQSIMNSDALETAVALTSKENDILTPDQIKSKFSSFSYNKGASVIHMLHHILGEENFYNGIENYMLPDYKQFKTVKPANLWDAWVNKTNIAGWNNVYLPTLPEGKKVEDIMTGWTENAGYPVVSVNYNEKDKKVVLQAQRFYSHETEKSNDSVWYIPITYTTSKDTKFDVTAPTTANWLIAKNKLELKEELKEKDDWIMLNIQSTGYFRVSYSEDLLARLQEALKTDHTKFHVLNRAQLTDDYFSLARAGFLEYSKALDALEFLSNETEYYPWYSAFNGFAFLKRRIDSKDEAVKFLNIYIGNMMENLYKNVSTSSSTAHVDILKRNLGHKWACELSQTDCTKMSQEQFKALKERSVAVHPDLRSVVYCTSIYHGKKEDWDYLFERFQNTKIASEITTIISALGCTSDETILKEYLKKSITSTSGIRKQDAQSVYTAVITGTSTGVDVGLQFLTDNFKTMQTYYGSWNAIGNVITSIADRLTNEDQVKKLKSFIEKNDLKEASVAAKEALESSEENLKWAKEKQPDLLAYLKAKASATSLKISFVTIVMSVMVVIYQW